MSKDTILPSGYKLQYGGVEIDYQSKLYQALDKGNIEEFKEELATIKESLGEDFDINRIRYYQNSLLSIVLSSNSQNKAKTLEVLTSEGMDLYKGVEQSLRGDYGRLDYTKEEIQIITDAINDRNVKALLDNALPRLDGYRDERKREELINTIHILRDGEFSQKYKINSDLSIECDYQSNLNEALKTGKAEVFSKALDALQESVTKDGIKFDINKIQIDGANILNKVMRGYSSEKPQLIKILAEKGVNVESGIAAYLQQPPAQESPDPKDIKMIADAMMEGKLGALRDNPVFKKCNEQVQNALDSVTRAMGIDTAFDQTVLTTVVEQNPEQYKKMSKVNERFSGLCDMICNYITSEDVIQGKESSEKKQNAEGLKDTEKINEALEEKYHHTHLLLSVTIGQLIKAVFKQEYPHSILNKEQQNSVLETKDNKTKIIHDNLAAGLENVKEGEYVKFCVFKKEKLLGIIPTFSNGHSMLIKKVSQDKFVFFDPNEGTTKPMTTEGLTDKLNVKFEEWNKSSYGFNEVCFINNSSYMKEAMTPKKGIAARAMDSIKSSVEKMKDRLISKPKANTTLLPSVTNAKSQEASRG